MATFGKLQDRVKRRVIDLPQAVQAEVPDLINEAIRSVQGDHDFKVMETSAEYVTVAGQRVLGPRPADWKQEQGFPFLTEYTSGYSREMTWAANVQGPSVAWDSDDTGYPLVLREGDAADVQGAASFEVWPLPDGLSDYSDGEYRITVPYIRYLPLLADTGDTNWFTLQSVGEEFIIAYATAAAFALDWDEQREAVWTQKTEIKRRQLIKLDKNARLAGVREMVPYWQGARTPQLRF